MNTSAALLAGLDALDALALKDRFAAARRAALAAGATAEVEGAMAALQAATRAGIVAMAGAVEASLAAQPLPAPPKVQRPGPEAFKAAAAGAARNAARPPSPMRRLPAPIRVPEEYVADAVPVAAAPPAPVPAPKPRGLANLRRAPVEDAPRDVEASTPASAAPAPQLPAGPPARRVNEASLDQEKLRALRARYRNPRLVPFIRPDGTPDWNAPAWDPEDDAIPF